jgi:hypothetical protein
VGDEVIGHRANGVGRAVEQVHAAVAVEINGVAHPAGGHELTQAHGTGVAAAWLERIDVGAVREA